MPKRQKLHQPTYSHLLPELDAEPLILGRLGGHATLPSVQSHGELCGRGTIRSEVEKARRSPQG